MNHPPLTFTLPRTLVNQLLHHAQQVEDKEVCGIISGSEGRAIRSHPITNIAASPACRFEMEPKQLIDTLKQMRERNEELFAIYHSHPQSPATPSKTDIDEAGYPEALYLIISLSTKGVLEMRGFKIHREEVTEVCLEV
ncbi:MAG: Mov34/MPN/PAD-1 family protein [Gammaproteobacteria bacterium]